MVINEDFIVCYYSLNVYLLDLLKISLFTFSMVWVQALEHF